MDPMAEPARAIVKDGDTTEVLAILRRIEPVMDRMHTELTGLKTKVELVEGAVKELAVEQRHQAVALARLDGRVSTLPTTWQMLTMQLGVMGLLGIAIGIIGLLRR